MSRTKGARGRGKPSKRVAGILDALDGTKRAQREEERDARLAKTIGKRRIELSEKLKVLRDKIGNDAALALFKEYSNGAANIEQVQPEYFGGLGRAIAYALSKTATAKTTIFYGKDGRKVIVNSSAAPTRPADYVVTGVARDGHITREPLPPLPETAAPRKGPMCQQGAPGGLHVGLAAMAETVFYAGGSRQARPMYRRVSTLGRDPSAEEFDARFGRGTVYES